MINSCYDCKNYSKFEEPRDFGDYKIYGKCFKKPKFCKELFHGGYNVYVPEGGCKDYKRKTVKKEKEISEQQLQIEL